MNKLVLCNSDDLPEGEVRRVDLDGRPPIAVYHVEGAFYATDDTCTHGTASLAEGFVEEHQIICPFHAGAFDIRTGCPTVSPCSKPLVTHAVSVEGGIVYLVEQVPSAQVEALP